MGYRPLVIDKRYSKTIKSNFNNSIFLEPRVESLKVSALDAFFFRVLNTKLVLSLKTNERVKIKDFSEKKYLKYAHGPTIGFNLKKQIEAAFTEAMQEENRFSRYRFSSSLNSSNSDFRKNELIENNTNNIDTTLINIVAPDVSRVFSADLGELLSSSYGFKNQPAMEKMSFSRLIQRGFHQQLSDASIASISSFGRNNLSSSKLLRLNSKLVSLTITELNGDDPRRFNLDVNFNLSKNSKTIQNQNCSIEVVEHSGTDAAWIVGFEKASQAILEKFLSGECR